MTEWQILTTIYVVGVIFSFVFHYVSLTLQGEILFESWSHWDFWEDVGAMALVCFFWPVFLPVFLIIVIIEKQFNQIIVTEMIKFVEDIRRFQIQRESQRIMARITKVIQRIRRRWSRKERGKQEKLMR